MSAIQLDLGFTITDGIRCQSLPPAEDRLEALLNDWQQLPNGTLVRVPAQALTRPLAALQPVTP